MSHSMQGPSLGIILSVGSRITEWPLPMSESRGISLTKQQCGRRHLDRKRFDHYCPRAEPAHATDRSCVIGQLSSLAGISPHMRGIPRSRVRVICRGAAEDCTTCSARVLLVVQQDQASPPKHLDTGRQHYFILFV